MRLLSILLLPAAALATAISPVPSCVTASLASYIALGSTGCQVGPLAVVDFSFTAVKGNNVTILPSDVTVTPVPSGPSYALQFSSPKFTASNSDIIRYLIAYTWDPGDIRSLDDVLNDPPIPPGFAKITSDICVDAAFTRGICPTFVTTLSVFDGIGTQLTASVVFTPPVATLGIRNTIDLEGGGPGGSVTLNSFGSDVTVPEPGTALLGVLSVALAGLSKRHRREDRRRDLRRW
jgi:hypothetical protein